MQEVPPAPGWTECRAVGMRYDAVDIYIYIYIALAAPHAGGLYWPAAARPTQEDAGTHSFGCSYALGGLPLMTATAAAPQSTAEGQQATVTTTDEAEEHHNGSRTAWVVESRQYTDGLRATLNGTDERWIIHWCGASGSLCTRLDDNVGAVVGMADAVNLSSLRNLRLVQSASNYYTAFDAVPPQVLIARYNPNNMPLKRPASRASSSTPYYPLFHSLSRHCCTLVRFVAS
jgi:hypothetical protein